MQSRLKSNRRTILMALAAQSGATFAQSGGKLKNQTVLAAQAKLTTQAFGDHRVYFDGTTDQLRAFTGGSLTLKPGATPHPPHEHPEEEILLVTEGTGEISIEGQVTPVGPGAMMYCAAGRVHGIRNTGKKPLLFYYFKWRAA